MLISAVQKFDSVINIYFSFFFFFNLILFFKLYIIVLVLQTYIFHILFHYGLSQEIEYSFLCSTVGLYCSFLYFF